MLAFGGLGCCRSAGGDFVATDSVDECLLRTRQAWIRLLLALLCFTVAWAMNHSSVQAQPSAPVAAGRSRATPLDQLRSMVGEDSPAIRPGARSPAKQSEGTSKPTRLEGVERLIDTLDTLTRSSDLVVAPIQPVIATLLDPSINSSPILVTPVPETKASSPASTETVSRATIAPFEESHRSSRESLPKKVTRKKRDDTENVVLYRIGLLEIGVLLASLAVILGFFLTLIFLMGRRSEPSINLLLPAGTIAPPSMRIWVAQPIATPSESASEEETFIIQGVPEPGSTVDAVVRHRNQC